MLRGSFVHRLFEILPDLPASSRWAAASRIAAIMGMKEAGFDKPAAFTTEEIKALFEAVEQVMSLPELASLFQYQHMINATGNSPPNMA